MFISFRSFQLLRSYEEFVLVSVYSAGGGFLAPSLSQHHGYAGEQEDNVFQANYPHSYGTYHQIILDVSYIVSNFLIFHGHGGEEVDSSHEVAVLQYLAFIAAVRRTHSD